MTSWSPEDGTSEVTGQASAVSLPRWQCSWSKCKACAPSGFAWLRPQSNSLGPVLAFGAGVHPWGDWFSTERTGTHHRSFVLVLVPVVPVVPASYT